ncbi:hypothetical protein, unlikely [Trypanosoma congolense IL3000]|uniref:Uncharacterized protein n=1 Tax=Trypanosoma congolense (strain IL3000) TaxID=1068625 RepID=F9WE87_TRYCI|nr:hypothetical protein, unlikely [Trypanosoma congolense IL3000]
MNPTTSRKAFFNGRPLSAVGIVGTRPASGIPRVHLPLGELTVDESGRGLPPSCHGRCDGDFPCALPSLGAGRLKPKESRHEKSLATHTDVFARAFVEREIPLRSARFAVFNFTGTTNFLRKDRAIPSASRWGRASPAHF